MSLTISGLAAYIALIAAIIALIAAITAAYMAYLAESLAAFAIASSRDTRASSRRLSSLKTTLRDSGEMISLDISDSRVNSSIGIFDGKNGSSFAIPGTRANVDIVKPNARAKGRGRTKLGETGQSVTPRPLERWVGRRTRKEWHLLFALGC